MEWYLKASDQGLAQAQFLIGSAYDQGQGTPVDYTKAMEWYLTAAEKGYAKAQSNLGFLYYRGRGCPQECKKAKERLLKATEQGNTVAQHYHTVLCMVYQGPPPSVKAPHWR